MFVELDQKVILGRLSIYTLSKYA